MQKERSTLCAALVVESTPLTVLVGFDLEEGQEDATRFFDSNGKVISEEESNELWYNVIQESWAEKIDELGERLIAEGKEDDLMTVDWDQYGCEEGGEFWNEFWSQPFTHVNDMKGNIQGCKLVVFDQEEWQGRYRKGDTLVCRVTCSRPDPESGLWTQVDIVPVADTEPTEELFRAPVSKILTDAEETEPLKQDVLYQVLYLPAGVYLPSGDSWEYRLIPLLQGGE